MRAIHPIIVSAVVTTAAFAFEGSDTIHQSHAPGSGAFHSAAKIVNDAELVSRIGLVNVTGDHPKDLAVAKPDLHGRISIDTDAALNLKRSVVAPHHFYPLVAGGLVAILMVVIGDVLVRRRSPTAVTIDQQFEMNSFVVVADQRDFVPSVEVDMSLDFAGHRAFRHFHPDALPITASSIEHSRPDYIRVDDSVEIWTPAKVDAARDPVSSARRRRTDAPGVDYRFHRLSGDGSVKTAERKRFTSDLDATRFAESLGQGDSVEVWLGDRRLTTIPANYFT